jgi:hypothetical protein
MTPVKQSKLWAPDGIHNGNCFAACLASILDIPLWMVPPFEDMFGRSGEWRGRVDDWLAQFYNMEMVRAEGHPTAELPAFYLANGPSPRGVAHSTIYSDGAMVHDPHPSSAGITAVEYCYYLRALEPPAQATCRELEGL